MIPENDKLKFNDYIDIIKFVWKSLISHWKSLNFRVKILVFVILIIGFLFYWYEYRPSQIRRECANEIPEEISSEYIGWERIYDACVKSKGLNN